jgi:hypothetical protein
VCCVSARRIPDTLEVACLCRRCDAAHGEAPSFMLLSKGSVAMTTAAGIVGIFTHIRLRGSILLAFVSSPKEANMI